MSTRCLDLCLLSKQIDCVFVFFLVSCYLELVRTMSRFLRGKIADSATWNEQNVSDVFLLFLEIEAMRRACWHIRWCDLYRCIYHIWIFS